MKTKSPLDLYARGQSVLQLKLVFVSVWALTIFVEIVGRIQIIRSLKKLEIFITRSKCAGMNISDPGSQDWKAL